MSDNEVSVRVLSVTLTADDTGVFPACVEGGTVYAAGSAMGSSTACEQCFCLQGARRCVRPSCLPPPPHCAPRPAAGACCPQRYYCDRSDEQHLSHEFGKLLIYYHNYTYKNHYHYNLNLSCTAQRYRLSSGWSVGEGGRQCAERWQLLSLLLPARLRALPGHELRAGPERLPAAARARRLLRAPVHL